MVRLIRGGVPLLLAGAVFGLLFVPPEAAAGPEKPPAARDAEYRSFVVRGAVADAVALDVMVADLRGEPLDGAFYELKDGKFEAVLPLPIGVEAEIILKALGRKGETLAEGSGIARFNDSRDGSIAITLASTDGSALGMVEVSPIALRLERINTYDLGLARYELHAFDADRRTIEISPDEVTWEIPFPEHITYEPCKTSGPGIVPCIEFRVPVKGRFMIGPEVTACVIHNTCIGEAVPPPDMPVNGYKAISAGNHHTCALTHDERILCWGENFAAQLARGSSENCRFPPPFQNGSHPCGKSPMEINCPQGSTCRYVALDAGFEHTCAIDTAGEVWCWGENGSGQLGFQCAGSGIPNCRALAIPRRVSVAGASDDAKRRFVQISAGRFHTCALSFMGNVYCWGGNSGFQLGSPGLSNPRVVPSPNKYLQVSAGHEHSCAVTTAGGLDCWGSNDLNRIHSGNPLDTFSAPMDARVLHPGLVGKVKLVAANRFGTCASTDLPSVVCWGSGIAGDQVVSGTATTDLELGFIDPSRFFDKPDEVCSVGGGFAVCGMADSNLVRVPGSLFGFTDVTVGGGHYCGVMTDGAALCWGKDNLLGQMGDGTQANHHIPGRVLGP